MRFAHMTAPEVGEMIEKNALVLLTLGQTEEHGPHLPTCTDILIGDAVAERIDEALTAAGIPVVRLDGVPYGYSVAAMDVWPATIHMSADTVINTMRDLVESMADMGFAKIAILNAHGNHPGMLEVVSRTVADDFDVDVPVLDIGRLVGDALAEVATGGEGASCHAGEFETSVMMHLAPELVRTDRIPEGDRITVRNPGGSAVFWSTWQRQSSASGAYGEPKFATAEKGKALVDAIVARAVEFLKVYYVHRAF